MNDSSNITHNTFVGFRAPDDFVVRFNRFSKTVGRNRSAVARYLIGQCLNAYEDDPASMIRIRNEIL